MGSGNLGARTPMALNSLSQAVDIGLPPLPSSSSLQAGAFEHRQALNPNPKP